MILSLIASLLLATVAQAQVLDNQDDVVTLIDDESNDSGDIEKPRTLRICLMSNFRGLECGPTSRYEHPECMQYGRRYRV